MEKKRAGWGRFGLWMGARKGKLRGLGGGCQVLCSGATWGDNLRQVEGRSSGRPAHGVNLFRGFRIALLNGISNWLPDSSRWLGRRGTGGLTF
jgi:hypothetical protein